MLFDRELSREHAEKKTFQWKPQRKLVTFNWVLADLEQSVNN